MIRSLILTLGMVVAGQAAALPPDIIPVNNFWNKRIQFAPEPIGQNHWQTPKETWKRRAGDCEDYAIAKYYTLLAQGIPADRLSMVLVVVDVLGTLDQHVVTRYVDGDGVAWVLDSIAPEVMRWEQRWDITKTIAVYDNTGVTWVAPRPTKAPTIAKWQEMRNARKEHTAYAGTVYHLWTTTYLTPAERMKLARF